MKIAYFAITKQGQQLTKELNQQLPGTVYGKENLKMNLQKAFLEYDGLVCVMATGIVVRILAPLFVHKQNDPAIVVLDSRGNYAISLLSGHLGGANALARTIAKFTGGQAVITTATDVESAFAFDLFAQKYNMEIGNIEQLKYISSTLLEKGKVQILSPYKYPEFSEQFLEEYDASCPDPVVVIDEKKNQLSQSHVLYLYPKTLWVGIGCKAGVSTMEIKQAVCKTFAKYGLVLQSTEGFATIPKKAKEKGIVEMAREFQKELVIVDTEKIDQLDLVKLGVRQSDFVKKTVGVPSVSTASAYIASGEGKILVDKEIYPGITVSIVQRKMNVYQ